MFKWKGMLDHSSFHLFSFKTTVMSLDTWTSWWFQLLDPKKYQSNWKSSPNRVNIEKNLWNTTTCRFILRSSKKNWVVVPSNHNCPGGGFSNGWNTSTHGDKVIQNKTWGAFELWFCVNKTCKNIPKENTGWFYSCVLWGILKFHFCLWKFFPACITGSHLLNISYITRTTEPLAVFNDHCSYQIKWGEVRGHQKVDRKTPCFRPKMIRAYEENPFGFS